jgi:transposase-like protein
VHTRGATQVDLFVTEGHDGLLAALAELFSATSRQRCKVHKQRNILNTIPRRERKEVQADLSGIWKHEKKEDALTNLNAFKAKYGQSYRGSGTHVNSAGSESSLKLVCYLVLVARKVRKSHKFGARSFRRCSCMSD